MSRSPVPPSDDPDASPVHRSDATEPGDSGPDPEGFDHAAQAQAAIRRIAGGADPAAEAFELSNRFTDAITARIAHWLRILRGDAPDDGRDRNEAL